MIAWVKWAGTTPFLLCDPHRSHMARQFIEQLGAQGTTSLMGAAEASWTRGLVAVYTGTRPGSPLPSGRRRGGGDAGSSLPGVPPPK